MSTLLKRVKFYYYGNDFLIDIEENQYETLKKQGKYVSLKINPNLLKI